MLNVSRWWLWSFWWREVCNAQRARRLFNVVLIHIYVAFVVNEKTNTRILAVEKQNEPTDAVKVRTQNRQNCGVRHWRFFHEHIHTPCASLFIYLLHRKLNCSFIDIGFENYYGMAHIQKWHFLKYDSQFLFWNVQLYIFLASSKTFRFLTVVCSEIFSGGTQTKTLILWCTRKDYLQTYSFKDVSIANFFVKFQVVSRFGILLLHSIKKMLVLHRNLCTLVWHYRPF